jgi:uncharacterized protein
LEVKFATFVKYTSDSTAIAAQRPQPRAYLAALLEQGKLVLAGPFTDNSGAMFIHEALDEAEMKMLLAADPFSEGIFVSVECKPWRLVLSSLGGFEA